MKKTIYFIWMATMMCACNNSSSDSVEKADSANKANRDSQVVRDDTGTHSSVAVSGIVAGKQSAGFLVKAMDGGMMEVDLGNVAKTKGAVKRVRNFGDMMVQDHSSANSKIRDLASQLQVQLPSSTGDKTSTMIHDLSAKSGTDFDKAYIDAMVKDHKEDIKEFEEASGKVEDSSVRSFINNTLPVLKKHYDSCSAIQKGLKNSKN